MQNNSIFEKTMSIILESKKKSVKASNKKLSESLKTKASKRKVEDDELIDKIGNEEDVEVMDDIADDIVVVVDPEISEDEFDDMAQDAQEIIDATPEGKVPMTDEYIGDKTYTCPICGNTFFSEVELSDGDECPVCGEFPSGFLLAGEVAEADKSEEPEDTADEPVEDKEELDIEEQVDESVEVTVSDDETKVKVDNEKDIEDLELVDVAPVEVAPEVSEPEFAFDESTFNPILTKFVRENYKNAKSLRLVGAKVRGKRLSLECKLTMKSGKSKSVRMIISADKPVIEYLKRAKKIMATATENSVFTEGKSKTPAFAFIMSIRKNVIRCESMKYNFISKSRIEGKKVQVHGTVLGESIKRSSKKKSSKIASKKSESIKRKRRVKEAWSVDMPEDYDGKIDNETGRKITDEIFRKLLAKGLVDEEAEPEYDDNIAELLYDYDSNAYIDLDDGGEIQIAAYTVPEEDQYDFVVVLNSSNPEVVNIVKKIVAKYPGWEIQ